MLLLVGDGPDRRRIERMVRRRGVEDSVIFTGSVPWEEMPAYTDAGDVFAMPVRSRWFGLEAEAFGIVYLEAAAWAGCRCMGGGSGGALEVALANGCSTTRRPRRAATGMSLAAATSMAH